MPFTLILLTLAINLIIIKNQHFPKSKPVKVALTIIFTLGFYIVLVDNQITNASKGSAIVIFQLILPIYFLIINPIYKWITANFHHRIMQILTLLWAILSSLIFIIFIKYTELIAT